MNDAGLRPHSAAATHEGRVREQNEDSFHDGGETGLWVVADGMGGHEHGEWASAVLVEEMERPLAADEFDAVCAEVAERIHAANARIFAEATTRGTQMGTTVVAMVAQGRRFAVLWVGDSRVYLLRGGTLHQLSKDHSRVQEMLDRGLLTAEEANGHPMSHVLARAIGVTPNVAVDVIADEVEPGDVFLLCSDGLHGFVPDGHIADLLGRQPPETAVRDLVEETLARGAPDNVTVIAVRFVEPTMLVLGEGAAA